MSILLLQGEGRSVLIIPEAALNAADKGVVFQIDSFIKGFPHLEKVEPPE